MTVKTDHRELVKAIAVGNTEKANALNDRIPDDEREDFHTFVTAFFSLMLEQRFKDDSSREAILAFVDEMRYDYRNTEPPIKPLAVEGLIRASCGEEHFFDEISPTDTLRSEFLVIGKIAAQSPIVIPRIEDFLTDAETLAAQWASEAG
ncbi:MAG: hypothetical protein ACRDXX_09900 [Stackebrandtia sp.]